jgi:DNA-binding HxlR family transcriptional regulator
MKPRDEKDSEFCPVAKVAKLLGDPCTLLIIRDLLDGTQRFGNLESSLSPISSRTITNKLKLLEEHGIILRKEFKEKPPRVEYSLTKEGKKLHAIIEDMRVYGKKFPNL